MISYEILFQTVQYHGRNNFFLTVILILILNVKLLGLDELPHGFLNLTVELFQQVSESFSEPDQSLGRNDNMTSEGLTFLT